MEPIGQFEQAIVKFQVLDESLREARVAEIGASKGAGHGGHRSSVVAGIHRREQDLLEVLRGGKEIPEGAGKGFKDEGPVVPVGKGDSESERLPRSRGILEHSGHVVLERREAAFDNTPDNLEVDAEVLVDQDVSQGRDAPPRNPRMLASELGRQVSDRLANDLQVSDDRILNYGVCKERAPPPDRVGLDPADAVPDMLEEDRGSFRSGRASAKMRSRR